MNDYLIYDFKTHSLYYECFQEIEHVFFLAIDTLEIKCLISSGKIIGVQGFLPLINSIKEKMEIKTYENGTLCIGNVSKYNYAENMLYNIFDKEPSSEQYFANKPIRYDNRGIVFLGTFPENDERIIKINKNIFCGVDKLYNLKCIYILPDKFLK